MISKDGPLQDVANWRPIAILPISYKLFARMLYIRISPTLFESQSCDQHAFTPSIRIEDALLCAESASEHSLEFHVPLWIMSTDMRKAFDRIDHSAMLYALERRGVSSGYLSLLQSLYCHQTGSVSNSRHFPISRGVKQRECVSAILFNCTFDLAFDGRRHKLQDHGLLISDGMERMTRYADDILLYAKSLDELTEMAELLIVELASVGLHLNVGQTEILHSPYLDDGSELDFTDINGNLAHRYLGSHVNLSHGDRVDFELNYRKQQGWYVSSKHKKCILNSHVSFRRRLQYFDTCVTPAILFALETFPLPPSYLDSLDPLQRKMMRRIVGWRSLPHESWRDTMIRMNAGLQKDVNAYIIVNSGQCEWPEPSGDISIIS